jgi:hypothetical protein
MQLPKSSFPPAFPSTLRFCEFRGFRNADASWSVAMEVTNMLRDAGASALLGILFHLCIQAIEFELVMFHYMALSAFTFLGTTYMTGFLNAVFLATCFNIGLLSSIAVYRLFLHRCKNFPGPVGAKLTKFYSTRLSMKNIQFYKELAAMHGQYGDFVRTGPREITPRNARSI